MFGKAGCSGVTPSEHPLCFPLDTGNGLDRAQEMHLLCGVLDVRVDEERVRLAVDVFDGNLEAVEASGFRRCDFSCKVATEVFVDDAIGGRKEGENMQDEVLFGCRESVPVYSIA